MTLPLESCAWTARALTISCLALAVGAGCGARPAGWGTHDDGVIYVVSDQNEGFAMMRATSKGEGNTVVSELPSSIVSRGLFLRGSRREYASVNRDRPASSWGQGWWRPTSLPGGAGHLHYYSSTSPAGSGFVVVRPDGAVEVVDFTPGAYSETYNNSVAINDAGTMLAAVAAPYGKAAVVKLLRLDGRYFAATSSRACDVTPVAGGTDSVDPRSLVFGAGYLYFASYRWHVPPKYLYRAPVDCSSPATPLALPQVDGDVVTKLANLHRSEDGKSIVLHAGSSGSVDLLHVDDANGLVTNMSNSPVQPGGYNGHYDYYSHRETVFDISPRGSYVAFTTKELGRHQLYVRAANHSTATILVTDAAAFADDYDTVGGVQFVNEDDLFFWVGPRGDAADLFHYRISTAALRQVTYTGGTTRPFTGEKGQPTLRAAGGWVSPNGKYLYTMVESVSSAKCNILAIDRETAATKPITQQLYVNPNSSNIEATASGGRVFFYAATDAHTTDHDLYVFDQQSASVPVRLTAFSGVSRIQHIVPNTDGSLVAFVRSEGMPGSGNESLYVAELEPTPMLRKLVEKAAFFLDMKFFTKDGKRLVYSAGGRLQVQPINGGAAEVVQQEKAGHNAIPIMVY